MKQAFIEKSHRLNLAPKEKSHLINRIMTHSRRSNSQHCRRPNVRYCSITDETDLKDALLVKGGERRKQGSTRILSTDSCLDPRIR